METHIWHAKRFKMETRWGVRYPVRCSDKSDRSTYRLVQRDSACIMDESYYSTIEVTYEDTSQLINFCKHTFNVNFSSESVATQPVYRVVMFTENNGGNLIAPVELLILKNSFYYRFFIVGFI